MTMSNQRRSAASSFAGAASLTLDRESWSDPVSMERLKMMKPVNVFEWARSIAEFRTFLAHNDAVNWVDEHGNTIGIIVDPEAFSALEALLKLASREALRYSDDNDETIESKQPLQLVSLSEAFVPEH